MAGGSQKKNSIQIEVDGTVYHAAVIETPFREGIELECELDDYCLRVSDLGLGLDEAIGQLRKAIKEAIKEIEQ